LQLAPGQEQIKNGWIAILHGKDILQKYADIIYKVQTLVL
jgi:hypothetical protein